MKKWVLERTQERSTWLGLIGVLTAAGIGVKPDLRDAIVALGMSFASLVAVVTKDK